jgi:predicted lipid-binding transport protein (Tim44 family)
VSDTPETDAQLTSFLSISKLGRHFYNKTGTVSAEFARKLERERDQWKADCLEQCQLLAQSADREEKMMTKTGFWESLMSWLEQVQEAYKGQDRDDLTQLYARGPFAGWSQERMVRLADELWENEQKYPLRGDRK